MRKALFAAALVVLAPRISFAPILGGYPGLDALIERADVIVIASTLSQETFSEFGGYDRYTALVKKVMKADVGENPAIVLSLRHLPHGPRTWGFSPAPHLLFLEKSDSEESAFRSLNCRGAHWELARSMKLDGVDKLSTKDAIQCILKDALEERREDLRLLEEVTAAVLKE